MVKSVSDQDREMTYSESGQGRKDDRVRVGPRSEIMIKSWWDNNQGTRPRSKIDQKSGKRLSLDERWLEDDIVRIDYDRGRAV